MKITICGSMTFYKEIKDFKKKLEKLEHKVMIPHVEHGDFHKVREKDEQKWRTLKPQFIRDHFDKIKRSDAIFVLNLDKHGIKNYIGGNTVFEIGLAFDLNKKIFLLNSIPENMSYTDELEAINPIVISEDLSKIV